MTKDQMEILEKLQATVEHMATEQNNMKAEQKTQGTLLREMDICLRGSGYNKNDEGVVGQVHENTKCISAIKKKQQRIIAWGITIFGFLNILGVLAVIWSAVKN